MNNLKKHFANTIAHHHDNLLFQAHSHHLWPDCAYDAMNSYTELVQKKLDLKWDYIFESLIPEAQAIIALMLNWKHKNLIAFGTNTHELIIRYLSGLFEFNKKINIVTTSYEYHSARRLFQNLEHFNWINLKVINTEEKNSLAEVKKLLTNLPTKNVNVCFISQCSFLSAYTHAETDLIELAKNFPTTHFLIDAYHSFAARLLNYTDAPDNLSLIAGGYKYAMSGEGICFLAMNSHEGFHEPVFNGWLAEFSSINAYNDTTAFMETTGFWKMMGATFDPIGLFRFVKIWHYWETQHIDPNLIRNHVMQLQNVFVERLDPKVLSLLLRFPTFNQGNFYSFNLPKNKNAKNLVKLLQDKKVFVDSRGQYLRFGFSPYIDLADVKKVCTIINDLQADLL